MLISTNYPIIQLSIPEEEIGQDRGVEILIYQAKAKTETITSWN
jgi:hypothetical protein